MKGTALIHSMASGKAANLNGRKTTVIIPLYRGDVETTGYAAPSDLQRLYNLPEKTRLVGYWMPEISTLMSTTKYSIVKTDEDEIIINGVSIKNMPDVLKNAKQDIKKDFLMWMDADVSDISASGIFSREQADAMYNAGHTTVNMQEVYNDIKAKSYDIITQSEDVDPAAVLCGDYTTAEKLLEYVKGIVEKEIASAISMKEYLEQRTAGEKDENSFSMRSRAVRNTFELLAAQGTKTCTAVFDFGYAKVEKKVSTDTDKNNSSWVENTRRATEQFISSYCQPITMCHWDTKREDFYPYVTSIMSRGKEVYHAKAVENRPENELYCYIINMTFNDCYHAVREFEKLFAGKDFDLSIAPKLQQGHDILKTYIWNKPWTLENVKYLVEHGAYVDREYWENANLLVEDSIVGDYMKSVISSMDK